jgi:hypothetical protein
MLFLSVLIYLHDQTQLRHYLVRMTILEQWSTDLVEIVFLYNIRICIQFTVCEVCLSWYGKVSVESRCITTAVVYILVKQSEAVILNSGGIYASPHRKSEA